MFKKLIILIVLSFVLISCDSKKEISQNPIMTKKEYNYVIEKIDKYLDKGEYKEAIKLLLKAAEYNKSDYKKIAWIYSQISEEEGEKWYKIAYEKGNEDVAIILGLYAEKRKDYVAQEKYLRKAVDNNQKDSYKYLGNFFEKMDRTSEAIEIYKKGAENKDAVSMYNLIKKYYIQNDIQNMKLYINKIRKTKEIFGFTYDINEIINYMDGNNNDKKAINLYLKSLDNIKINKIEEAEKNLKEIEKYKKEGIKYLASFYYYTKNEKEKAVKMYKKALLDGIDVNFEMGTISEEEGKTEEAKKYYLISSNKGNPRGQTNLAQILKNEGTYKEAEKWYIKAAEQKSFIAIKNLLMFYDNEKNKKEIKKWILKIKNEAGLKDYNIEEKEYIEKLISFSKEYCDNFKIKDYGIFFYGKSGAGKTYFASAMVNYMLDKGKRACFITATEFFELMSNYSYSFYRDKKELQDRIDFIRNVDFLVIDDLGNEILSKNNNSFLSSLLDYRIERGLNTIITSNLSEYDLAECYDSRVASRIRGNFKFFVFPPFDLREKIGKNIKL